MHPFELGPWHDLFVAEAGAAAALAGLLFVAVSINITRILQFPSLPGRAAEALMYLMSVLAVSTFGLIPGQPVFALGIEVLAFTVLIGGFSGYMQIVANSMPGQPRYWRIVRASFWVSFTVPMLAGGISLIVGAGGGLYWLPVAMVMAVNAGVINSWILLVEILR